MSGIYRENATPDDFKPGFRTRVLLELRDQISEFKGEVGNVKLKERTKFIAYSVNGGKDEVIDGMLSSFKRGFFYVEKTVIPVHNILAITYKTRDANGNEVK